jgi:hypothetical protein
VVESLATDTVVVFFAPPTLCHRRSIDVIDPGRHCTSEEVYQPIDTRLSLDQWLRGDQLKFAAKSRSYTLQGRLSRVASTTLDTADVSLRNSGKL